MDPNAKPPLSLALPIGVAVDSGVTVLLSIVGLIVAPLKLRQMARRN